MEAVGSIIITLGANGLGFPEGDFAARAFLLVLCDVVFVDKGLLECLCHLLSSISSGLHVRDGFKLNLRVMNP